jgi:dTDP-3,4-didehydro-2,6-dideoxy-alpha-D-glucose 3-reductase
MRSIRVAVWGVGHHASANILPAIAEVEGLELYGVCSRNPAVVSSCMNAWSCRGWTEPGLMLQDSAVDVIYVATPSGLHAAHGRQVLSAGKHLWCEKPLGCFLHETLDLLEMAESRRVSLCEAFMYLYHPQFERLSRYLSDGGLGAIRSITCRFGIPNLERASFRNDASLGGGALLDVGCYPISAIQALFPEDGVQVTHASVEKRDGSPVDTDGHAVIALSSGAEAYLEWRSGCSYRNEIDLWGENGSVSTQKIFSKAADYVPEFRTRDLRGVEKTESGASGNHFLSMLRSFRGTIDDPAAAESERSRIAMRAGTLDMIRTRACVR